MERRGACTISHSGTAGQDAFYEASVEGACDGVWAQRKRRRCCAFLASDAVVTVQEWSLGMHTQELGAAFKLSTAAPLMVRGPC